MSATFTTINDAVVALQTGKVQKGEFLSYAKSRQCEVAPLLNLMVSNVLTQAEVSEIISAHQAIAAANAPKSAVGLHFKVSEKGAVSVYGLQARFPVTLYGDQWTRLLDRADDLRKFLQLYPAEAIGPGDHVYWDDPEGTCSRTLIVKNVTWHFDMITIEDVDGDVVSCPPHELRYLFSEPKP